jgi:hypothetical protein
MQTFQISVTDQRQAQSRTWSVEAANAGALREALKQEGATVVVIETLAFAVGLGGGHCGTSSSDPIEIDRFSEKEFAQLVSPAGTGVASPEGVSSGCFCGLVITK